MPKHVSPQFLKSHEIWYSSAESLGSFDLANPGSEDDLRLEIALFARKSPGVIAFSTPSWMNWKMSWSWGKASHDAFSKFHQRELLHWTESRPFLTGIHVSSRVQTILRVSSYRLIQVDGGSSISVDIGWYKRRCPRHCFVSRWSKAIICILHTWNVAVVQ